MNFEAMLTCTKTHESWNPNQGATAATPTEGRQHQNLRLGYGDAESRERVTLSNSVCDVVNTPQWPIKSTHVNIHVCTEIYLTYVYM